MADLANMDLPKLIERFGSEDRCRAYLEQLRWPEGIDCPRCGGTTISRIRERNQFDCDSCRYQFSVTAGTLLHDSHLPLWKWFLATYLMVESKKGISANQLKRMLGTSYKTAWYLSHRIRDAMGDEDGPPLEGIIEIDETYVGGKADWEHRWSNKAIVVGAVERGGRIRLRVIANNSRKTLHGFAKEVVDSEAEAIYTDEWLAYQGLEDEDTRHETVTHTEGEYVRGDVHTNTVESAWSLLKRGIVGSWHKVSVKHLPAYLDEMEWRMNGRKNPFLFRDTLLVLLHGRPMPYETLVRKKPSLRGYAPVTAMDPEGH
jgi:transposase-like protein